MTDDDLHSQFEANAETSKAPVTSPARRRFAQVGGALLPAILSLSARPTWASGGVQCLSSRLSGNLSNPTNLDCNFGNAPLFWRLNPLSWPAPYSFGELKPEFAANVGSTNLSDYIANSGTRFVDLFPGSGISTRLRVLFDSSPGSPRAFFAAARLSAQADPSGYSPNATQLLALWETPTLYRAGATRNIVAVEVLAPTFL